MYVAREAQGGGTGSARRRRERRLRAYLRHARMSVAMALAETQHHSAQRPKKARARGEEREEPGGGRPSLLLEPQGAQPGGQRHIVEQMADVAPKVQILDAPVPQEGIELADILKCVDTQSPVEQVIDVPKIFLDSIQPRSVLRRPQTAEQLVEVPTIISYSSLLQRAVEQIVDILGGSLGGGGLHGFLPDQSSTSMPSSAERISEQVVEQSVFPYSPERISQRFVEQIVDSPVARGVPLGLHPEQNPTSTAEQIIDFPVPRGHGDPSSLERISERVVEQFVDIPVARGSAAFGGAHHGFLPGSSSTAFYGAQHHEFLPGSSSTAFGGAQHLHHLPLPLSSDAESSGVDGVAEFRPMRFCRYFGSGMCFKGDECTFAHAWDELHPHSPKWGAPADSGAG